MKIVRLHKKILESFNYAVT